MMTTVYVGLSGGVDSATSAALLQQRGYRVVGVFIKIWQPEFIECTWRKDRLDAMRVAATLGIPFKEIDLSAQYESEVVKTMLQSYASGETPNPDVLCNKVVKFGAFARWAFADGADMVATGHYARIGEENGRTTLVRGIDTSKDQSYFLHLLSENDLQRTLFPLGELTKLQVRKKAQSFGLPVASKPDSQGLCFVGDVSMRDFLKRFIPLHEGNVVDSKGSIVGIHEGAALYTVGQRHGFTVEKSGPSSPSYYVVSVDTVHNTITVSANRSDVCSMYAHVREIHWISGEPPADSARLLAQTRYHGQPVEVTLAPQGDTTRVLFSEPHIVSPGQSIVFYSGDTVLGGGVLHTTHAKRASEL